MGSTKLFISALCTTLALLTGCNTVNDADTGTPSTTDGGSSSNSGIVWGSAGGDSDGGSDSDSDGGASDGGSDTDGGSTSDGGSSDGGSGDGGGDCDSQIWYADNDLDGFGNPDYWVEECDQPEGYVDNDDDLDDGLAVVGDQATPAKIYINVDIEEAFSFGWNDLWLSEANTWGSTSRVFEDWAFQTVSDFRPTHPFELNGYYIGEGGQDEWLVGAGNTVHITALLIVFEDDTYDTYQIDETGATDSVGVAYFTPNDEGGGNLAFEAEPDFEGEHYYEGLYDSLE